MNQAERTSHFVDWDNFEYNRTTLLFLRKKLDDFTIDCFRMVVMKNKESKETMGLVKTRIDSYAKKRKRYDAAFLTLEVQGFIEKRENGPATPYYLTVRGKQLGTLLVEEKKLREGNNNG